VKVGILTFHWVNNYGALLQAYALSRAVRKLGHSVRFINYVPTGQGLSWWQGWGFRSGGQIISRTLWRLRFELFRKRYLPATRCCRSRLELEEIAEDFDAIIVGSDQVWNGHVYDGFDSAYYLDFADYQKYRLISYAACFGDPRQSEETFVKSGALLSRFNFLSVRNSMSAKMVKDLSGIEAEIVVDPTLLHDFSEFINFPANSQGYILVYYLSDKRMIIGQDVLRLVKKKLCLPVVVIGASKDMKGVDRFDSSTGPLEWLRLFQGASFVCTDSFHGTIFSIKYRKPFVAWSGFRPERIKDLLIRCELERRLVDTSDEADIPGLLEDEINFDEVSERLSPHIKRSLAFLKRSLT
jgi:hypothetical protein